MRAFSARLAQIARETILPGGVAVAAVYSRSCFSALVICLPRFLLAAGFHRCPHLSGNAPHGSLPELVNEMKGGFSACTNAGPWAAGLPCVNAVQRG